METILRGIGEVHLEVLRDKLQRKFGVELELHEPRVAYRETIRKSVKVQASTRSRAAATASTVTSGSRSARRRQALAMRSPRPSSAAACRASTSRPSRRHG